MLWFKKKEPTFYERESKRIQAQLESLKPGTDEYKATMTELTNLRKFAGDEKEMNQLLDKSGRGNIIGKIVGFLGLGGLAFGLARFEKNGNLFSGSSNSVISGIVKIGTRFFS